jgi:thiamine biosynthesis lipoprotein
MPLKNASRKMRKYLLHYLVGIVFLTGCTPSPESHTFTNEAFSRPLEVTVIARSAAQAETAAQSAIEDLQFIAEVSHPWKPGPLGRTNQLLALEAEFSANPSVLPMIRQARQLSKITGGYYAPAQGKLQQLWGFQGERPAKMPPDAERIKSLLEANPQMEDIHIEGIRMRSDNATVRIDFGAFAQGYAIDTAMQRLREHHIKAARISNGNAMAVLGSGWSVHLTGLADTPIPLYDGEAVIMLTTAGKGETDSNHARHPFLDPKTGYPSRGLRTVTVIHSSAATAAAMAQALLAGGEKQLANQLEVLPVEYAIVTTRDGRRVATHAMAKRLGIVRDN